MTQAITLRDMFTHRSGLPGFAGDLLEDMGYSREEVLYRLRYEKPVSSFRSAYAYTNFGLTEAAVAAARAAGRSWEDVSAERLYRPAGMSSTSSRHADYIAAPKHASLHVRSDGEWLARYDREPDAQSPAGGVSSTARDLTQWMRLHLAMGMLDGRQLISAEALAETHRPQIVSSPPADPGKDRAGFYGLGWNVAYDGLGRVRWNHSGAFEMGAATTVTLMPAADLGIAVLTNGMPIGVPETIASSFIDLALDGAVSRDWAPLYEGAFAHLFEPAIRARAMYAERPAQPGPPLAASAYIGVYHNDYFGAIEIEAADSGFLLRQGPGRTALSLQHWDGDTFVYEPVGENAHGPSAVVFSTGPDQQARSLVIDHLNAEGNGTFLRVSDF